MKPHLLMYKGSALCFLAVMICVWLNGCLTPEQRIAAQKLHAAGQKNQALLKLVDDEIMMVQVMFEEGKINAEELNVLLKALRSKKKPIMDAITENKLAIKEAADAESPWWVYLLAGLGTAGTVAARIVGGRAAMILEAGAASANAALGTISRGVDLHAAKPEAFPSVHKAIGVVADRDGTRKDLDRARILADKNEI